MHITHLQTCFGMSATTNGTLPSGVVYVDEKDLAEKLQQNELNMQEYRANGSSRNGNCAGDHTHKMPVCFQICSEWCWATAVTMTSDYYKGQSYCQGFECAVAEQEFGGQCCPFTNSCHNQYKDPATACNRGGTSVQMRDAAAHFTGGSFTNTGPLSQADLDKALNTGRVVMIAVRWQGTNTGHALIIGGCGNGYYYLHDPWGWYRNMGFPQPNDWQGLTYDQLLRYPSPTAVGDWTDSIFWSWSAQEEHEAAIAEIRATRASRGNFMV